MIRMREHFNKLRSKAKQVHGQTGIPTIWIMVDCLLMYIFHQFCITEYFRYEMYRLNQFGRKQLLSFAEWSNLLKVNSTDSIEILNKKDSFLNLFNDYVKRDWVGQNYHNTYEEFYKFCRRHHRGITKPLDGSCGEGIYLVELDTENVEELYYRFRRENRIMEEVIVQHEKMSSLHSESVNTIRVMTVRGKIMGAILRVGAQGMVVDNVSSGGCYAPVDIESGFVASTGVDFNDQRNIIYTYDGAILPGFQIPMWDEVCNLVKNACKLIPETPVVGWDVAIMPTGPVLIEGNRTPNISVMEMVNIDGVASRFRQQVLRVDR